MVKWVGLLIIKDRKYLLTREKGKDFYAVPGGGQENGENDLQTLKRELREELDLELTFPVKHFLTTELPGKGENMIIHFTLYIPMDFVVGEINKGDDIEELLWIDTKIAQTLRDKLALLSTQVLLPMLKEKN